MLSLKGVWQPVATITQGVKKNERTSKIKVRAHRAEQSLILSEDAWIFPDGVYSAVKYKPLEIKFWDNVYFMPCSVSAVLLWSRDDK
jgi:hypothetical protein